MEETRGDSRVPGLPDKFHKVGARIPHGVLLYGPPGTGRPTAGQGRCRRAKAPLFSISGSEFMELYVGGCLACELSGAPRRIAPASSSSTRSTPWDATRGSVISSNDERETGLNKLLVRMDGHE